MIGRFGCCAAGGIQILRALLGAGAMDAESFGEREAEKSLENIFEFFFVLMISHIAW